MQVRLLRDARVLHKAGEVVEVSPEFAEYLISLESAEAVEAEPPKGKKTKK